MMIALPRAAPPTSSTAPAVVWVNSPMLARVPGPADLFDRSSRRLGELVDVGSGSRPRGPRRHRSDDLGVGHRGDPGDRVHHGDRGLAATRDHRDVRRADVLAQVDGWANHRTEMGGSEVYRLNAGLRVARGIRGVRSRRRGFEDQLRQRILAEQPVDAFR